MAWRHAVLLPDRLINAVGRVRSGRIQQLERVMVTAANARPDNHTTGVFGTPRTGTGKFIMTPFCQTINVFIKTVVQSQFRLAVNFWYKQMKKLASLEHVI